MSYKSGISQNILSNILYSNSNLEGQLSGDNISSIEYVNTEFQTVQQEVNNISLTSQMNQLTILQNEINNLQNQYNILLQKNNRVIGSIITTSLLIPPSNYKLCNGDLIPTTDYPELFNIIGYSYGGSGFNFALPNINQYFILGANNTINNLPVSNLFSGNGFLGATNNYLKFGNISTFPIIDVMPSHTHTMNNLPHSHIIGYDFQPYATTGLTHYVKSANQDGSHNSDTAFTNISMGSGGRDVQEIDNISNITGLNYTPPFISINFYMCVS